MSEMKKYVREFPFYIARDFGAKEIYDLGEIETTFDKYKFPLDSKHYAYAMFADNNGFEKLFSTYNDIKTSQSYREEIADKFFEGNSDFKFYDLIKKTRFRANVTIYKDINDEICYELIDFPDNAGGAGGG
jgi:hypothetical protein